MTDFCTLLRRTVHRYQYIIHLFVLMDNHFHILLETPHANLSQIMQYQNSVFAQRQNRRRGIDGHVTQGRFKAILVEKERYYFTLIRYTHTNPVPELVLHEDFYYFSSHQAIINPTVAAKWSSWYDPWIVLSHFGESPNEARHNYRTFMSEHRDAPSPFEEMDNPYILGSEDFQQRILEEHQGRIANSRDIIRPSALRVRVPWEVVVKAVCAEFRVCSDDLLRSQRGRHSWGTARCTAIAMATKATGLSHQAIGQLFGGISGQAISCSLKAFQIQARRSQGLQGWVDYLLHVWGCAEMEYHIGI